jgi:hypothetical protein
MACECLSGGQWHLPPLRHETIAILSTDAGKPAVAAGPACEPTPASDAGQQTAQAFIGAWDKRLPVLPGEPVFLPFGYRTSADRLVPGVGGELSGYLPCVHCSLDSFKVVSQVEGPCASHKPGPSASRLSESQLPYPEQRKAAASSNNRFWRPKHMKAEKEGQAAKEETMIAASRPAWPQTKG